MLDTRTVMKMILTENEENKSKLHKRSFKSSDVDRLSIFEIESILQQNEFFSNYSDDQLSEIALIAQQKRAGKGEYLCRQGNAGDSIFLLLGGHVGVLKREIQKVHHVYTAGPGEILGEIAVLGNIPRSASLKALDTVDYFEIDGEQFIRMLHDNPDMSLKIIRMLVFRFAA